MAYGLKFPILSKILILFESFWIYKRSLKGFRLKSYNQTGRFYLGLQFSKQKLTNSNVGFKK